MNELTSFQTLPFPVYTIDTSAWARLGRSPAVHERLRQLGHLGIVTLTPPVLLEIGFDAPSPNLWDTVQETVADLPILPMSAQTHAIAVDIQRALWHSGRIRAAGVFDTLVAALAVEHGAMVIHYDADYDLIGQVRPDFHHEWVVTRGSID
jgi:predicted nucleic acid-binding protein